MKIVQINTTCGSGSTGKICAAISELLTKENVENYILYSLGDGKCPLGKKYMIQKEIKYQALKSRIFGNYGFQSKSATKRLIKELEIISPDIVHLHNMHGHNAHMGILFKYLKKKNIKVLWTFHDCWAFTAYCPYYDLVKCNQWKMSGCNNCPQIKRFSWFLDRSQYLFDKKKTLFTDIDLTIITPSQWLADQVEQSFLKKCDIKVINNGIDLSAFYPRESNFREKYGIGDKFIVLGVALGWEKRKGLDVFVRLSEQLDEKFKIVLVGTNDGIDKQLPANIISIHRTQNQAELAEIYSAADLFVNPTREEVFGLVNVEALACGTPVVTYNTGGSPECIDEKTGMVVDCDDEEALYNAILKIEAERLFTKEDCISRATKFSEKDKYKEYVKIYRDISKS